MAADMHEFRKLMGFPEADYQDIANYSDTTIQNWQFYYKNKFNTDLIPPAFTPEMVEAEFIRRFNVIPF